MPRMIAPFALAMLASATLAGSLSGAPASAQDAPPHIWPTRDVTVTYAVIDQQQNRSTTIAMHWKAGGTQARIDLPGGSYAIVDRAGDLGMLVLPRQKTVMRIPLSATPIGAMLPENAAGFVHGGSDTVAGHRCDLWSLHNAQGDASVCLTADGVVLRAQGKSAQGGSGGVIANVVTYGPIPRALLEPPADFARINLPAAAATMMMPPARSTGQAPRSSGQTQ